MNHLVVLGLFNDEKEQIHFLSTWNFQNWTKCRITWKNESSKYSKTFKEDVDCLEGKCVSISNSLENLPLLPLSAPLSFHICVSFYKIVTFQTDYRKKDCDKKKFPG